MAKNDKNCTIAEAPRAHDTLVCVDSDGCVFDTMEIKQKRCIQPRIVSHWNLEPIRQHVLETAEFVNLYSQWRGTNRFKALLLVFDFLRERPEVEASGIAIPEFCELRKFVESGCPLGNASLAAEIAATDNSELSSVLEWSICVNNDIEKVVTDVPPFPWAVKGLDRIRENSDSVCISQTPREALLREWRMHEIDTRVSLIAGQEAGTKEHQIQMASMNRYSKDNILVIGDSMGDLAAADACGSCFFPIEPTRENESWQFFCEQAYSRFLSGGYTPQYQANLVDRFKKLLPSQPPWLGGSVKNDMKNYKTRESEDNYGDDYGLRR